MGDTENPVIRRQNGDSTRSAEADICISLCATLFEDLESTMLLLNQHREEILRQHRNYSQPMRWVGLGLGALNVLSVAILIVDETEQNWEYIIPGVSLLLSGAVIWMSLQLARLNAGTVLRQIVHVMEDAKAQRKRSELQFERLKQNADESESVKGLTALHSDLADLIKKLKIELDLNFTAQLKS